MIVTPLPACGSTAVQRALLSHGWEGTSAEVSAAGLEPWAYHLTGASAEVLEALLGVVPKYGLDLLTGNDWAVLSGTRSRLSAMARSWTLPPALAELAVRIGQGLPADPLDAWRVRSGPVGLAGEPILLTDQPVAGARTVLPDDYRECRLPAGDPAGAARAALADGAGLLLSIGSPREALALLDPALDAVNLAGADPGQVAVDPGWGQGGDGVELGRFRAFGRVLACTTDHPVIAAMAWRHGARLFRTAAPAAVSDAIRIVSAPGS